MDIKAKIEELVEKIKSDKNLISKFKADPIKTVEELIGIDLPNDQIEKVVGSTVAGSCGLENKYTNPQENEPGCRGFAVGLL